MRTINLSLLAAALLLPAACEDTTAKVVGTAVKAAKDTAKGIERGIEDGRKAGASTDEAIIVTKPDDLTGHGTIQVGTVTPSEWGCDVELVVENASDRPLRISSPDITAIDAEGFAKAPRNPPGSLTVAARAKDKLVVQLDASSCALDKVRVWTLELEVPRA